MDTFTDMAVLAQATLQVVWNFAPAILAGVAYGVYDAIREMNTWRI